MLEKLNPISDSHSVSKVVITLFLPQTVIKPEKIIEKINNGSNLKNKYQRRKIINSRIFNFSNKENELSFIDKNSTDSVVGFILEQFDDNGEIGNIIILRNEDNSSVITYETRKYIRWANFYDSFLTDIEEIIEGNDLYFEAISLKYIDEFVWLDNSSIPVYLIFEKNSELINTKFLNSKNGTIVLFSQKENLNIEEMTEISFNNELKGVQIIHEHATKFRDLIDSEGFKNKIGAVLTEAHKSNKDTLNELLSSEVKQKINFT